MARQLTPLFIRLPRDQAAALDRVASESGRAKQYVVSELVAQGAPNRSLLSSLFLLYNLLLSLFGLGVFFKARNQPAGKMSGILGALSLLVVGMAGLLMELAFPQDPGGTPTTFAGTMHFVMAAIASVGSTLAVLFLAIWVRHLPELKGYFSYALVSVAIIFNSGVLTAAALENQSSLFGLFERITIGTFILWVFILGRMMVQLERHPSHSMYRASVGSTSKGE